MNTTNPYHKVILAGMACISSLTMAQSTTLYSIGEPSPKELLMLEYINRSRAFPTQEGQLHATYADIEEFPIIARIINVIGSVEGVSSLNINRMQQEFTAGSSRGLPVLEAGAQPLTLNASLLTAAREHSQEQFDRDVQTPATFGDTVGPYPGLNRMENNGYDLDRFNDSNFPGQPPLGSNVFANTQTVLHGHSALDVDWGGSSGGSSFGMQINGSGVRGHRDLIHRTRFKEIGIGILEMVFDRDQNSVRGPLIITQDFAVPDSGDAFITGVSYYDLNENNFYDIGEGIGGLTVEATGANFHAESSTHGAYAIPIQTNGNFPVTFTSDSTPIATFSQTISNKLNVKQDLRLPRPETTISGASLIPLSSSSNFAIEEVYGANSYTTRIGELTNSPEVEDADGASDGYSFIQEFPTENRSTAPAYNVVQSTIAQSGNAFRLVNSSSGGSNSSHILTLERVLYPRSNAELTFRSRFSFSRLGERARVEVSTDEGANWIRTDYNQAGTDAQPGESSFSTKTVDLSSYAGRAIKIRFHLEHLEGGLYNINPVTFTNAGWFIDNIAFNNFEEVLSPAVVNQGSSPTFSFTPAAEKTYRIAARGELAGGSLPYGDGYLDVTADDSVVASPYDTWANSQTPAVGSFNDDDDGDGFSNLSEYAFGMNPNASDAQNAPALNGENFSITRPNYDTGDITYSLEESTNMSTWTTTKTFNLTEPLTFTLPLSGRKFFRWRATYTP